MNGVCFVVDCADAVEADNDEAGFAYVSCPSPSLAWQVDLRACSSRALLRAADGSLWLLGTQGLSWTSARLAAANARICRRPEASLADIVEDLARNLIDHSASLAAPSTLCARLLWDIRAIATLMLDGAARGDGKRPGQGTHGRDLGELERQLEAKLGAAVAALVGTLNADIAGLASQPRFDARVYNWLLRGDGERRGQFARAFPLLLSRAASGGDEAHELSRIVDRGEKLVDRLAAMWSVRPGVVRLLPQPLGSVAPMWSLEPRSLAATLNALPPETWPRDAQAWLRLDELVNSAIRTLTPLPWASTFALAWLRDRLTGRDRSGNALASARRDGVVRVQQLRDALIEMLVRTPGWFRSRKKAAATDWAVAVVDGFLLKLSAAQQLALADRYRDEVLRSVGSEMLAERIGLLQSARGWPLLPGDYVSADGARRAVPICSRQELRRCGEVFGNCLRGSHLDDYARSLVDGSMFYLLLLDAQTNEPRSLASFKVDATARSAIRLALEEHETAGNVGLPSPECRGAVADLLRLATTAPLQEHLRKGLQAMRVGPASTRAVNRIIGRSALAAALWRAIGAQGMTAIVRRMREHADGAATAAGQLPLPL